MVQASFYVQGCYLQEMATSLHRKRKYETLLLEGLLNKHSSADMLQNLSPFNGLS